MALFNVLLGGFWSVSLGVLVTAFLAVRATFLKVEDDSEPAGLSD